jgi:hypothetical protein
MGKLVPVKKANKSASLPKAKKSGQKKDEFSSLSVEALRRRLGDSANKEIFVRLGTRNIGQYDSGESYPKYLNDLNIEQLSDRIYEIAENEGAPVGAELKLQYRKIPVTRNRRVAKRLSYGYEEKVTTQQEGPYWVITFTRPLTDEEIKKDGPTLLRNKKKADERAAAKAKKDRQRKEAERRADIEKIKALAAKHGVKVDA